MIKQTTVYEQAHYIVLFNSQSNAYKPFSVFNTITGEVEFSYRSLGVCQDYISDNI